MLPEDQMQCIIIGSLRACPIGPPRGKQKAESEFSGVEDHVDKMVKKSAGEVISNRGLCRTYESIP